MTALGHEARRVRRRKIAAHVRKHGSTAEAVNTAAEEFGVNINTVRNACREHGVVVSRSESTQTFKDTTYSVIAALCNSEESLTAIGLRYKLSSSRVSTIYRMCVNAGIPVHQRKPGGGK